MGHKAEGCWSLTSNIAKHPANWKPQQNKNKKCNYCGKDRHLELECFKKKNALNGESENLG